MKAIKKIRSGSDLPISPTQKPKPEDAIKVAVSLVSTAQACLLSPSAVIASLRCALDLYAQNAINKGFDVDTVGECEKMGQALAKAFMDAGGVKQTLSVSPLVDASGAPLQSEPVATET